MRPIDYMEEAIKKELNFTASTEMLDRILDDILKAQEKSKKTKSAISEPNIGRIIMKSRMIKFSAAAVIIIAVVLSINIWEKSIPTAYAFEQTIAANNSVRYIHIKHFDSSHEEPKEFWIECDGFGHLKSARWHMPEWDAPEDGAKVVLWKENRIQLWFKGTQQRKSCLVTYTAENAADWAYDFAQGSNPRLAVERLQEKQEQGEVNIEIDEPSDKSKPIVVTATYLPESSRAGRREVLFVDRATKLVTAIEFYRLKDARYEYQGVREYYDYNQPIDAEMFNLENEVPPDVKRIDEDLQTAMLNQRLDPDELQKYQQMTPKEMTKAFLQACAEEDWDEFLKFTTDSEVNQKVKDYNGGLEIISIGEPFKSDNYHGWYVPYEIRLKSGEIKKWNLAVSNRNLAQRYLFDGGF
ncbi:MAG: hypothetical protein ACETVZ_00360 [Phycisphaerae bacterium]